MKLALGYAERPVIAYGFEEGLAFQPCDDALCTTGTQRLVSASPDAGGTASLVLRTNGVALISYVDSNNDQLSLYGCNDTICSFPFTRLLGDVGAASLPTSIALAGSNPVIAYAGVTGVDTQVRLFVCNPSATCAAGGTVSILDASAANLAGLALAIRAGSLRPLVAYAEAGGPGDVNLVLYDCADASCTTGTARTIDGATDSAGQDVSMTRRADGRPILAYYGATGADLRIYDCADVDCASGTVRRGETTGNSGRSTSIALRADGRPLISHYQGNVGLRLWDCIDVNCTSGTARPIDSDDNAGQNGTAVVVRSDDRPVVGYLSLSGARMRVHTCGQTDCATPP